tara:strand:- start:290 stop:730 length:441 start_codon:yes stop_codon:yes gene_type:complete
MSSITNIYLHFATNLDSHYKTIDDYILEKHQKKINNNNNNIEDNLLTGVKSSHDKYYDKFYNPSEKRLPIKSKYIEHIRDNITKCPSDYSNQIKTILKNNNLLPQMPGYTKDDILHELRYVDNVNYITGSKYKRNIPFPVSADFFK